MPEVTREIEIDAPPEQVWELIGDTSRTKEWNTIHVGYPEGAPELAVGAKFREQITIMGMPGEAAWTVASIDPPNSYKLEGDGPMGITVAMTVEVSASNGATKLAMTSAFDGPPLEGPMGDSVAAAGGQAADASLARVKEIVSG